MAAKKKPSRKSAAARKSAASRKSVKKTAKRLVAKPAARARAVARKAKAVVNKTAAKARIGLVVCLTRACSLAGSNAGASARLSKKRQPAAMTRAITMPKKIQP